MQADDQEFLAAFTSVVKKQPTDANDWQSSKKSKKQIRTQGNTVDILNCTKCSKPMEQPKWSEVKYGRQYKPICDECKTANVEIKTVNVWKAKCCVCKNENDLFFVDQGDSVFTLKCVACCPKMQ